MSASNSTASRRLAFVSQHVQDPDTEEERVVAWNEILRHTTPASCWIVYHGGVFDVTTWLSSHPGGEGVILSAAGTDCSKAFDLIHSRFARLLRRYYVGRVAGTPPTVTNGLLDLAADQAIVEAMLWRGASKMMWDAVD